MAAAAILVTGGVFPYNTFLLGAACIKPAMAAVPTAEQIMSDKIKDMTATLHVTDVNRAELKKMGGAFATTYSIKKMDMSYKYPNKARFEGRFLGAAIYMVYNGDEKYFRTPIKTDTRSVKGQPGQKQTLMDIGIFAKDYLTTDYKPNFVRQEGNLLVFKLSQRGTDNKTHEMVWVNPKNAIIEKRRTYNGEDVLQKELRFTNPRQIRPGIWVPTRIEIYNTSGKLGAAQAIEDIKVNLGISDDVFKIS
jgi:outer membrane lipoprotein-sorting protein